MKKINKKAWTSLIIFLILLIAAVTTYRVFAYNNTKGLEQAINKNDIKIAQIENAKNQLHITADIFRQDDIKDDEIVSLLQNKWERLSLEQKELEKLNEFYWEELESKLKKRKYLGQFELTAYCQGNITATGTTPTENRTIAVDPKVIPYDSIIEIEGYGTYIAEDCGGAVKGNIIDIYMKGYDNCIQFGRKTANVYIIRE